MSFTCKAPWVSVAFQPTGIAPCCIFEQEEPFSNFSNRFETIKESFIKGVVPLGCRKCQEAEKANFKPYFKHFEQFDTDYKTYNLQEINLRANNHCNLACRSCGPHYSSKWELEFENTIRIVKNNDYLSCLTTDDLKLLKNLVIEGGEPSLLKEHFDLLSELVRIQHTKFPIRISTNGHAVKFKNHDLIALWKSFEKLRLQISVDAVGEDAANIRSGTNWKLLAKNLEELEQHEIKFFFNITVSALNIWFLEDTVKFLVEKFPNKLISFNLLYSPDLLSLRVIPKEFKTIIEKIFDNLSDIGYNLTEIKKFYSEGSDESLWQHFLIYNLILDQTRNETFFKRLPIKKELIERWIRI